MLVGTSARRVAIVGGVRIPFARGNGAYAQVGNQELLTAALRGRGGALRAAGSARRRGGRRRRHEAFESVESHPRIGPRQRTGRGDPPGSICSGPAGTSLEAAILLANKIALGQIDSAIAGGVDTVSDPPVTYPKIFQQLLLKSFRARSTGERIGPWLGLRMRHLRPVLPGITEPRTGLSMGESTELMVKNWGVTRADQDQLAYESHFKASAAYADGFYKYLVQPYLGVTQDNNIRSDTSVEKLAKLRPAFRHGRHAHRGNSTPMTDGASAVPARHRGMGPASAISRCWRI